MKKSKILMPALAVLTLSLMGCSFLGFGEEEKKEEEKKKKEVTYETFVGTELTEAGTTTINGKTFTIVKYGDWPQTIKSKNVEIDDTKGAKAGAHVYFKGSDGAWYYEAKESAPVYLMTPNKYSDGTKVTQGEDTTKWFKVEPIQWRVLTTQENKSLLLAESILSNCAFYDYSVDRTINKKTFKPNNYEHSRIRAYLNGINYHKQENAESEVVQEKCFYNKGFLQTAFAGVNRSNIVSTKVKDDAENGRPYGWDGQANTAVSGNYTSDKIFLLSEYEATNMNYGFLWTSAVSTDDALLRKPTDFAKANGVFINTGRTGAYWWLRTPEDLLAPGLDVRCSGDDKVLYQDVRDSLTGVVPALWVKK